jgi:hypothetical protein
MMAARLGCRPLDESIFNKATRYSTISLLFLLSVCCMTWAHPTRAGAALFDWCLGTVNLARRVGLRWRTRVSSRVG